MLKNALRGCLSVCLITLHGPLLMQAWAQTGDSSSGHQHASDKTASGIKPPKLFLDKPPKVIEYQLKRLSNAELLLAERSPDDAKYIPVFKAILLRAGVPAGERRGAAEALAKLEKNSIVEQLLAALGTLTGDDAESTRSIRDLTGALLSEPKTTLSAQTENLTKALQQPTSSVRRAAAAALLTISSQAAVEQHASASPSGAVDFLEAIKLLRDDSNRNALRSSVLGFLAERNPDEVRRSAIRALATISSEQLDTFRRMVSLVDSETLREDAVKTLLSVPVSQHDKAQAQKLVGQLVDRAEATPIDQRTTDAFLDTTQLAESLLSQLEPEQSRAMRERLRQVAVRVVRVRTVEEEMRYDLKYFAVEAGRPVEIVLRNEDLMPHNLVITQPGALKEIAMLAAQMAPDQLTQGKQYVPADPRVLWATGMVPANKQERLSFSAPKVAGEYPFVCTFPNHWMRMYGVMVVVDDLDAWQKDPKLPADPIGNNRSFVAKWTVQQLEGDLATGLKGRSAEIGARLFKEATCLQCHKMKSDSGTIEGGIVGPDLSDVSQRWKQDARGILQEILVPSHKIDPKYAMQSVLTSDGKVYSGIIVQDTQEGLSLITSPDQPKPIKIARDDIDEVVKSTKSIMPAGLLDQYTRDEIMEILAYLMKP